MEPTLRYLQHAFSKHALLSAIIIASVSVAIATIGNKLWATESIPSELLSTLLRYAISFSLLAMIVKLGWGNAAGITRPFREWPQYWWLACLPLFLVAGLNLASISWENMAIEASGFALLLFHNFSVGLFEEVLLRGTCFYILYRAWGHTPKGVMKAAIVQAVIFGLLHLLNLQTMPAVDVIAQVIYATLLGIGFAALVAYTRTIWLAVTLHTCINSAGDLEPYFMPDYIVTSPDIATYAGAIIIISLLVTLPGFFQLQRAQTHMI